METRLTRRRLLEAGAAALVAPSVATRAAGRAQPGSEAAGGPPAKTPTLCFFSKHLPDLDYRRLGETLKQLGFAAVDLTVRPGGHVLPERAAEDLPRAVQTLRDQRVQVPMITTGLNTASEPAARPILSAAGKLGVPFFKPGYYRYRDLRRIDERLRETREAMRGLVELGREHGVQAGFHNHSGDYVGAAMWDAWEVIRELSPRWAGFYFDPCHAVAEGGQGGWEIGFNLLAPRIKMVAVKDFYWEKSGGQWRMTMCPLGEGMVPWQKFFRELAASGFAGPISLHLEYDLPADPLPAIARDFAFLQARVREAYS